METTKIEDKLNERQIKAIPFLLACSTVTAASKEAGVSITQLYAWMKNSDFKAELERQRAEIFEGAVNRLKYGLTKASDVLVGLLDSDNEAVRRGAANDLFSHVAKFKELQELECRLVALEDKVT